MRRCVVIHTEKSFRNLIKSSRNQIVFTIFRLIWNKTGVCLDLNQSENGKYNLILGWFNKISKRFLCVHWEKFWLQNNAIKLAVPIASKWEHFYKRYFDEDNLSIFCAIIFRIDVEIFKFTSVGMTAKIPNDL